MTNTMQRRHFEVIAGILKTADIQETERQVLADMFAEGLGVYNTNFDKGRFVTACLTGNMGKVRSHKNVK